MYENVFQRVEQKYLLDEQQKQLLFEKINHYLKKDPFYESTICNIYFDNENHDLIVHSLEKDIFKEKIRIRSYQVPSLKSEVFLEIKEKYNGIVGKRRVKMTLEEFYRYYEKHEFDKQNQTYTIQIDGITYTTFTTNSYTTTIGGSNKNQRR